MDLIFLDLVSLDQFFFLNDMIYNLYRFCMLLINLMKFMNLIYFEYRVDQKNGEGKDWDKKDWEYNK